MQQPTQHLSMLNKAILPGLRSRERCLLLQSLVRASFVVEGDVFDQHAAQMALVDDQKVIEALFA